MGKIGDLWVKLGLKKQEFDKGMNDADQKTEGFGSKMQKIKGIGLAVWAAIGGAVLKIGKDIVGATNQMEDAWAQFTTKAKAGWNTFLRTLANGDWSNFITNFKAEVAAAARLQEVLDADTEIMNSIAIQKARIGKELAELEIAMRDQTKSYKERADAAKKYLNDVLPIYDREIERAKKLKQAQYQAFFGDSDAYAHYYQNEGILEMLDRMLIEYGSTEEIINGRTFSDIVGRFLDPRAHMGKNDDAILFGSEVLKEYEQLLQWFTDKFNAESGYTTNKQIVESWMTELFKKYETNRNGLDVQALVDAVIGLEQAKAAYDQETKKVQSAMNTAIKGMSAESSEAFLDEFINDLEYLDEITDEPIEIPEIDVTPIESAEEALDDFVAKWQEDQQKIAELNAMLGDSIVSSMSNGLQAITDMMMGLEGADMKSVLSAFLMPFADTLKQMGSMIMAEGIAMAAFKDSFTNPGAAIAAGAALIAIGSIVSSGLQALTANPAGSGGSVATTGASAANTETYKSELTVYVEGKISGKDIVLSGNNTLNSWRR